MRPTADRIVRTLTASSVAVSVFWIGLFLSGEVSPSLGIQRIRAGFSGQAEARATTETPSLKWHFGDVLTVDRRNALLRAVGDYRYLLIVRLPSGVSTASWENFVELLGARHAADGLTSLVLDDDHARAPVLAALDMLPVTRATVLLDSTGRIKFAFAGVLLPDMLRQLMERVIWGKANNQPPTLPSDPDLWEDRLRTASMTRLNGEAVDPSWLFASYRHIAVFDAHCSRCRIARHMEDLARIADSLVDDGARRMGAIIPDHYRASLPRAMLDSIRVDWIVASETIAPELALITRDIPQAAPVLLELDGHSGVRSAVQIRSRQP